MLISVWIVITGSVFHGTGLTFFGPFHSRLDAQGFAHQFSEHHGIETTVIQLHTPPDMP
jgi:hypothetical protein